MVNTGLFVAAIIAVVFFAILAAILAYLWQREVADASSRICPEIVDPPAGQCMCASTTCPCPP